MDVGLQNDEWVEILGVHSGGSLAPGDEVVVSDHLTLAHEAKISVRKDVCRRSTAGTSPPRQDGERSGQ